MFFFERIRPEIQKALFKRINAMNREKRDKINSLNPISEAQGNPLDLMLTKSCWVRVHSTLPDFKKDENGKIIRPLEPAKDSNDKPFRISGHFKDGQPLNRALTSKVNLLNNPPGDHLRAPAGVTGVTCNFMDKSVQKVTVNFKLYDTQDFEIYEHAFLKHGRTVLVEFGWSVPDTEFSTLKTRKEMLDFFYGIENRILEGNGDYHAAIGTISSFSFDIGQNGEYNCSFDLMSLGNTLFKGQVDGAGNNPLEIIKRTNDTTLAEAYRLSGLTFTKTLEKLNEVIKDELAEDDKRLYYNENTEKGYCTWGWFEDVILNKFFSTIAEVQDKEGTQNLTTNILSGEVVGKDFVPNKCRNNYNLFTLSKDIILPGKIIGIDNGLKSASEGKGIKNSDDTEEFKNLYDTFFNINDKFEPFSTETFEYYEVNEDGTTNLDNLKSIPQPNGDEGIIRNMVFSADFLNANFRGITTLEDGLENFWMTVSNAYGRFWDFRILQNKNNNGQVEVADAFIASLPVKESNPENFPREKSTEEDPTKTFVFPIYSTRSLFKDFNITVAVDSQMATQAVFHSSKDFEGENAVISTGRPEDKMIKALGLLSHISLEEDEKGYRLLRDGIINKVTFPNLKGLNVKLKIKDGKIQLDDTGYPIYEFEPIKSNNTTLDGTSTLDKITIEQLQELASYQDKIEEGELYRFLTEEQLADFENAGLVYDKDGYMIQSFQNAMIYILNYQPDSDIGLAPVTPIKVSFTMPGIGGIRMFDMFAVDYIPEIYRRFGLFQVSNIDHTLSPQGWETKVEALLRLDIEEMLKQIGKQLNKPDIIREGLYDIRGVVGETSKDAGVYIGNLNTAAPQTIEFGKDGLPLTIEGADATSVNMDVYLRDADGDGIIDGDNSDPDGDGILSPEEFEDLFNQPGIAKPGDPEFIGPTVPNNASQNTIDRLSDPNRIGFL